jgi:hypothetical protein
MPPAIKDLEKLQSEHYAERGFKTKDSVPSPARRGLSFD